MTALEIWAMVNEDGEYVATHDEDNLSDLYSDCVGGTPANCRTVKLTLINSGIDWGALRRNAVR
jgi:hypothetical protein